MFFYTEGCGHHIYLMKYRNTILIVDDDITILNMLRNSLSMEGYDCETASNARDALEIIEKTNFDLMVTDINMHGMSGFEMTQKVKHIRPDLEIIIMTGLTDDFSYDAAIRAGASDFIKKPFSLQELLARINHLKIREDLRKRLKELEEFYDIAIGRELKVKLPAPRGGVSPLTIS